MTENQDLDGASSSDMSFEAEERAAQKTAFKGRLLSLAAIAVLTTFLSPWPGFLYIYFLLLLFVALGYGSYLAAHASCLPIPTSPGLMGRPVGSCQLAGRRCVAGECDKRNNH